MLTNLEYDEVLVLSIIYNHNEKVNSLQINDKVFRNSLNKKLLLLFIKLYKENKRIDTGEVLTNLKTQEERNYVGINIMTNDNYDEVHYEEDFTNAQRRLLKNYKTKMIEQLNKKFEKQDISISELADKINKINAIRIDNNDDLITLNKLNSEIYSSNTKIMFTRFKTLERNINLYQNDLLIIGASTGVGKSALMLNLMEDLSNNYQCMYFNLEMAQSILMRRLVGIFGDVPIRAIDTPQTSYQQDSINDAKKEIAKRKLFLINRKNTLQDIRVGIASNKDKNKHTIVFIDHLGLLKVVGARSLYEQTTEIAKELRQISLDLDCTIICASQLNRNSYSEEIPMLNMLKDSGEIENSARKVILLYRNPDDKKKNEDTIEPIMNIEIAKNDSGMFGTIKARYYKIKQRFEEMN